MKLKRSMPVITLPWANFLYAASNVALVVGATGVLLGTIGTVWMGSVKERYGDDRIAANEAAAATANARAAQADEGAAKATQRTAELELATAEAKAQAKAAEVKLEIIKQQVAPRNIDIDQFAGILKKGPSSTARIYYVSGNAEIYDLAFKIFAAFDAGGWTVEAFDPLTIEQQLDNAAAKASRTPLIMKAGGQPTGVTVLYKDKTDPMPQSEFPDGPFSSPVYAVQAAFLQTLHSLSIGNEANLPDEGFRIIVAERVPAYHLMQEIEQHHKK